MQCKSTRKAALNVTFDIPLTIDEGNHGLFYVTSPMIKGLLISGATADEAIDKVQSVLQEMAEVAALENPLK